LATPVAIAMNFGTKLTITQSSWKIIVRCLHLPLRSGPRLYDGVI